LSEFKNIRSVGVRAITLDDDDELVTARIVTDAVKNLFIVTKKGMCVRFELADTRELGRTARGVTGIRFKEKNDLVVGAAVIYNDQEELLAVSENGIGKRTTAEEYRLQKRGGKGVICMKLTPKTKDLVDVVIVDESKDLMALTSSGKMIRVDMQTIRKAGRNTSGVKVVSIEGDDKVVSIARCPKEEDDNEGEDGGIDTNDNMLDVKGDNNENI
jgi:DNA gyrase subunit A